MDDVAERPLRYVLHSQSLFARKPFLCVHWEMFILRSHGAYSEYFFSPSRRETHVLFFFEKSLL
jgi:hypothetical protein